MLLIKIENIFNLNLVFTICPMKIIPDLICTGRLTCIKVPLSLDLAKNITSVFPLFFCQIKIYNDKYGIFTGVNTFWTVQSNRPVIDALIKHVNMGKKLLFQYLTFLSYIKNYCMINVCWFWQKKKNKLQSIVMEFLGQKQPKRYNVSQKTT